MGADNISFGFTLRRGETVSLKNIGKGRNWENAKDLCQVRSRRSEFNDAIKSRKYGLQHLLDIERKSRAGVSGWGKASRPLLHWDFGG